MFDWISELVAGRKESLSFSTTEHRQRRIQPLEIEAVWMKHRQQQHSSQPEAAHALYSSHEEQHIPDEIERQQHIPAEIERQDSIQLLETDDEQAIEAAIKPENRILTLQGMMFQPRNQALSEGLQEQVVDRPQTPPRTLDLQAAASTSTMMKKMIEQEVRPPETLEAAAKLLHKAEVQYSNLDTEYQQFHYTVGRSLDRRLKPLFNGYLQNYQASLFFTDTEDPMEMNKELNNLLQKRNEQKALLENSLEESRKQFVAKYEEIRRLALEAAQLERDIIEVEECSVDDNNNKGSWLTWLYAAVAAFYAAAAVYTFKILSPSPSIY